MKFAICQELFEGWDWERQCRFIAEVGYEGIEIAPFTLASRIDQVSPAERKQLRQTAADAGLQVVGLHWLLAKTEGLHLTSNDTAVRKATAAYLEELGRACGEMGGRVLVFGSPPQRNLTPGVSTEQALENAANVFRAAMPAIAEANVKLCFEPLTKNETDFINTCAEAMELIERVAHPNFILHQDVKAMLGAESDPIPTLIERHIDHLGHFHVNDTNLLGPGMGDTDFAPILAALETCGYRDWVSVEVFDYSPGAERIARESLAALRAALPSASAR